MTYELTTQEYKGTKIEVKTNIAVLKQVWNILKDVKLDGLLTGGSMELQFNEIIDSLLLKNTLTDFIETITTGLTASVEQLDIEDIVGIISLFFTSIAHPFQGLNIALSQPKQAEQTTEA